MIGSVRDRATFAAFGRSRQRARRGWLTVSFVADDALGPDATDGPTRVAYSIGRKVGGAVERNRLRRRLRAVMSELSPQIRPGAYLIAAGRPATDVSYQELKAMMSTALHDLGSGDEKPDHVTTPAQDQHR